MFTEVFLGVLLAGIALLLIYWAFTTWSWIAILGVSAALVLAIKIALRPSREIRENREQARAQRLEEFAESEKQRVASLRGYKRVWHSFVTVYLYIVGALIGITILGLIIRSLVLSFTGD